MGTIKTLGRIVRRPLALLALLATLGAIPASWVHAMSQRWETVILIAALVMFVSAFYELRQDEMLREPNFTAHIGELHEFDRTKTQRQPIGDKTGKSLRVRQPFRLHNRSLSARLQLRLTFEVTLLDLIPTQVQKCEVHHVENHSGNKVGGEALYVGSNRTADVVLVFDIPYLDRADYLGRSEFDPEEIHFERAKLCVVDELSERHWEMSVPDTLKVVPKAWTFWRNWARG